MLDFIENNFNVFLAFITFIGYLISLEYRLRLNKIVNKNSEKKCDDLAIKFLSMQTILNETKEMVAEIKGYLKK